MHSRVLRIVLVVACIGSVAAAAAYIRIFEQNLTARRATMRDVDARARDEHDALDRFEADTRKQQIVLAAAAAGFVLLVTLLLAVVSAQKKPEVETADGFLGHVAPGDLPIEGHQLQASDHATRPDGDELA